MSEIGDILGADSPMVIHGETVTDTKIWEQIISALPYGCLVVDQQAVICAVNPSALKLLGAEQDQILNQTLFEALPFLKNTGFAKSFSPFIMSTPCLEPFEFELSLPEGCWIKFSARVILEDPFDRRALVLTLADITETVRLKKQLRHTEYRASVGKIARGIAHELNNPLDGVLRYTHLAMEKLPEDAPEREYLVHVKEGLDRMVRGVRAFLEFSRQATTPVSRQANLNQLIDDAMLLVQHRAKFQQVRIVKEFESDLPPVMDAGLQYAVVNLIKNAFDAMPKGGTLTIRTFEKNAHVYVEIADTGFGIPREAQSKIFEPFFSTKPIHQGNGLGLIISKEAVERSGGDLGFTSEEGVGTTFHIRVPLAPQDKEDSRNGS